MTNKELKELETKLWHSADMLRSGAHLAANKYGQPILGLIFLRYADVLFKQYKEVKSPKELIKFFKLDTPIYAELCRNGLFSRIK